MMHIIMADSLACIDLTDWGGTTTSSPILAKAVAQVQATLRRRILRAFVGRGLIESVDAKDLLGYQHSSFSVDAGVCTLAHDRAALERLLRYCARPLQALVSNPNMKVSMKS
jgi:hypothetical protein